MMHTASAEMRFTWRGVPIDGARRCGELVAADAVAARATLKRDGVIVLELEALGPAPPPKASAADVTVFTRQLAGLLRADLPLADAGTRGGLPHIVRTVARDITRGVPFSSALSSHPSASGALYCQLVAVGEVAGALPAVLTRLADDRERAASQRAKLRGALAYPVMVLLLSLAITAGLLIGVVPMFKTIFDGFGAALPAPTRFVLALSDGVARHALPFAACCACVVLLIARWLKRSPDAREHADRIVLTLPLLGALLRSLAVARWSCSRQAHRFPMPSNRSSTRRAIAFSIARLSRSPCVCATASASRCTRCAASRRTSCSRSRLRKNPARSTRCCSISPR